MKTLSLFLLAFALLLNCKNTFSQGKKHKGNVEVNQGLVDELYAMAEIDQIAANMPQGKYKDWPAPVRNNFKGSVFTTHKKRLNEILKNSVTLDTI